MDQVFSAVRSSPGALLEIGVAPVTLATVASADRPAATVALAPAARDRMVAARAVIDRYATGDEPIYGLNTGLGGNLAFRIPPGEIQAFQEQFVRGRSIGVSEPFSERICRSILLSRLVGLAQGGSGVSLAAFDLMLALFNRGLTPVIPGRASIGAADLGLAAYIGLALIGRGEVYVEGRRLPAAEALAAAGLQPVRLGAKDGLAICNANPVAVGYATVVLAELADLLATSCLAAALSDEGYAANPRIFDARLATARPAKGQERAAALFRALLQGSYLHEPGAARSIQDAVSFRVVSQIYGPALTAFESAVEAVQTELNSASESPLVLVEDGLILSSANFHTPSIALAMDMLAIVDTQLATASAYRSAKLMTHTLSGLPKYLSPVGGPSNGFVSLQKTLACLHAEVRLKATPASLDALPVSETVEDHAPQTPLTIRKLQEQLLPLRYMIAIEAMTAAQAVDLRGRPALAPATRRLYEAIRDQVPMLTEDRETGADAERIAGMMQDRSFLEMVHQTVSLEGRQLFALD